MWLVFAVMLLISMSSALLMSSNSELSVQIAIFVFWGAAVSVLPTPTLSWRWMIGVAVGIRLIFVLEDPIFSDDLYRYLWEGKLVTQGGNPYLQPPVSFDIADSILSKVNHPSVPSVYPPIVMWVFAATAYVLYDPIAIKLLMALADCCVLILLAQLLDSEWSKAWVYALHPLPIIETAGSGHLEPLAIAPLLLGIKLWRRKKSGGAFWIWVSAGVKILPALFLPLVRKDYRGMLYGSAILALSAYSLWEEGVLEGIFIYAEHWSFNGSLFPILDFLVPQYARLIVGVLGGVIVAYSLLRWNNPIICGLWITGTFLIVSPTVHPWYGLWVFPFAVLCFADLWLILLSLLPISYVALLSYNSQTQSWSPPLWPQLIEYGIPLFLWGLHRLKLWETGLQKSD